MEKHHLGPRSRADDPVTDQPSHPWLAAALLMAGVVVLLVVVSLAGALAR